jgi:1-acyl-sn-glycerol-3-phosphate acyltransferase
VQPAVLRYADARRRFSPSVDYTGSTTLLQTVWRVAGAQGLVAHVDLLPPQGTSHADRRALAASLHAAMTEALAP